jgi:hypothetical protein
MRRLLGIRKLLKAKKAETFLNTQMQSSSSIRSSTRRASAKSVDMTVTTANQQTSTPVTNSSASHSDTTATPKKKSFLSKLRIRPLNLPIRARAQSVVMKPIEPLYRENSPSQMAKLLSTSVSKPEPIPQQSHQQQNQNNGSQQQNSQGQQNSSNNQDTSARNGMLATGAVMTGAGLLFGYYNRERSVETTKEKLDAQQALSDDVLLVRSNENIGQLKRSDQIHENQCVSEDAQALYDDEESRDEVIKKYKNKGYVISELNLILPWEDARAYPFDELLQARPAGTERGVNPDETFESISGADDNENVAINKVRDKLVSEARCGLTVTVAYNPHTKKAEIIHDKAEVGTTVFVSTDPKSKETSYVSVPGIALKHKATCRVDDNGQVIVDAAVSAKGGLVAAVDAHRVAKDNLIKLDKDESVVVRGKRNIYDLQRDKLAEAVTPAPSATVTATINPTAKKMQVKLNHTLWPGISGSLTTNGKGIVFNGPAPISSDLTREDQIRFKPVIGLTQGALWRLKDAGTITYDNGQVSGNSNLTATTVDKDSYNSSNFKPVKTLSAPTETVAPTQSVTVKPS